MRFKFKLTIAILLLTSCDQEESRGYRICNNTLGCSGVETGEYCTFGYKWGVGNPFPDAGGNKPGPSIGPVEITFTFIPAGYVFNTHSQNNLVSRAYDGLPECAMDTIRNALARWEAIAGITFVESSDQGSNIKIIVGDITQAGVAFPPFPDKPCSDLAGQIAIKYNPDYTCEKIYTLAIHEIGHALGLGHVQSNNVMNPQKVYHDLQPGDIEGIQSIYGRK